MRIRLKHERLAAVLAASRLSQNHWALRFGLSRGHLSDLLKGRHPYVSARTREKLLAALGIPFDDLFEEEHPPVALPVPPRVTFNHRLEAAMSALLDDLRYTVRVSARHRMVTGAVVATMALGIAVTTAVYSIVQAVLLNPLPFEESEQVLRLGMVLRDGRRITSNGLLDIEDYRRHAATLSDVTAVSLDRTTITSGGTPEQHDIALVDHAYDDVFRIRPAIGRFFAPGEYDFGAARVVLISDRLWRARFGADPGLVGRSIDLDHEKTTVIGVLPPMAYLFPSSEADFVGPLRPNPRSFHFNRGALWLQAAARMRPGVTVEQAEQDLARVVAGIADRFPDSMGGLRVRVERLHDAETRDARAMLILLSAAVATVLLIGCVNIANLLLGHSHARTREFAVRAALGGRAARLRRQVLTESLALSAVGGVIGVAVAPMLVRALLTLYPGEIARLSEIVVDWRVGAAGLAATTIAGVLSGIPTARRASRIDLTRDLRHGGRGATGGTRVGRLLIASQVALSLALLFASVLLVQTLRTIATTHPGFEATSVTTFYVNAPRARYRDTVDIEQYFARAADALRALPGMTGVATSSEMPFEGSGSRDVFIMKERGDLGHDNPQVRLATVSPDYWGLLRAPMRAGRPFSNADDAAGQRVVIVNEALAERYYPGQDPVGRVIDFNREDWQIVGVAGSMRMESIAKSADPELYVPAAQLTRRGRYMLLRSAGPAPALADLSRALGSVDPTIAITDMATMADRVSDATAPERFRAVLFSSLGLIALVLSSLGIYSVLADVVTRQTREIGIRLALGEGEAGIRRRVVASAFRTVLAGAVVGVGLSFVAGRWLSGFLVGVDPWNAPALAAAAAVLGAVALAAAYIPARRASRVDPITALRAD